MTSLEVLKPPHTQGAHRTQLSLSPGLQRHRPDPRHSSAAHAFLHSSPRSRFPLLNLSHLFSLPPLPPSPAWVKLPRPWYVGVGLPHPKCGGWKGAPTSLPSTGCPGITHALQAARLAFALSPKGNTHPPSLQRLSNPTSLPRQRGWMVCPLLLSPAFHPWPWGPRQVHPRLDSCLTWTWAHGPGLFSEWCWFSFRVMCCVESLSWVQFFVNSFSEAHRLFSSGDSPSKNTRVGCHALLQGVFLNQVLNPGIPPCR